MLTLVTVIYGDDPRYRAELFGSVLSILKQRRNTDTTVVVYTDQPLTGFPLPVTERVITPREWQEWTLGSDITHLAKLHLVRETLQNSEGPVIYFDTDTLFLTAPEKLAEKLTATTALMHADEGPVAGHDVWKDHVEWLGGGREVCGHRLSAESIMYNSGIVGVMPNHLAALHKSVDIAAALHAVDPVFSLDQFSTSVALAAQSDIETCTREVLHYWGWDRVFIRHAVERFWQQHENASLEDLCEAFHPHQLAALPQIHWLDKVNARFWQLRWRLNSDGRFACLALKSALRQAQVDKTTANHWFSVHLEFLGFLESQQAIDATRAAQLRKSLASLYPECRPWLNPANAAALEADQ